MNSPILTAQEVNKKNIILIVDKVGAIGQNLAVELSKDFFVFLVSDKYKIKENKNIIYIPFKNAPKIPDNKYSKILIIDDGTQLIKNNITKFIKKAVELNAELFFILSIRNPNLFYFEKLIKNYTKIKLLVLGDLFDNKILFDKDASITRFIIESRKNNKILIRGDGLNLNYPIDFNDSNKLIIKSLYLDISQKIILLFYKFPITDISLANTFKSINPEIDVDFKKTKNEKSIYVPSNSINALTKYDFKKRLNEINLNNGEIEIINYKSKNENTNKIKYIFFILISLIFILLLPFLATYTYTFLGYAQIDKAKALAEKGDFEQALDKVNNAKSFFQMSEQTSDPLRFQAELIRREDLILPIINKINSGNNLVNASTNLLNGVVKAQNAKNLIEFNESISYFKNANIVLQELKATDEIPAELSNELKNITPIIDIISNTSEVLGSVLGYEKEKQYLVLYQNNLNLKPSGGEIEYIGLLKIKNGKINEFKITPIKELDNKLINYGSSPYPINRISNTSNYFLKDTSIYNNYQKSATDFSILYEEITGNKVDGVISINLNLAKRFLETNKINIRTNSNELITDKNLFEYIIKNNLSINVLSLLTKKISNNVAYFSFGEVVGQGFEDKDILVNFNDILIQKIFNINKLSNDNSEKRIINENNLNDFFGFSEANFSGSNTNYFVSRIVSREIRLDSYNQLNSSVKISIKNNSLNNLKSENYKCYLQFILPEGSKLNEIYMLGKKVNFTPAITNFNIFSSRNFIPPSELEVEEKKEGDKIIFGFFINVLPDSVRNIVINYTLPYDLDSLNNSFNYSLLIYKQPGMESFSFSQKFNLPEKYIVLPTESISKVIKKDEEFKFLITKEN